MKIKASIVILILILSYWLFQGFKLIEPKVYPVVSSFSIETIEKVDNSLIIEGTLYKNRDCKFTGITVYDKAAYPMRLLDVTFLDTPTLPQNRIVGYQAWGVWKLTPYTKNILIQSQHKCTTGEVKTILYDGII